MYLKKSIIWRNSFGVLEIMIYILRKCHHQGITSRLWVVSNTTLTNQEKRETFEKTSTVCEMIIYYYDWRQ